MGDSNKQIERARLALEGLSIGDAFGERFFKKPDVVERLIAERALPQPPWRYTDDTVMALALYDTLADHAELDVDHFAAQLASRYRAEPHRGYGSGAHELFHTIATGVPWRDAAGDLFDGTGSFGNGSAMRVAPLGAFYADDLDRCANEAARSAQPTHQHPEGVAGAIATAVATAAALRATKPGELWEVALEYTPESEVRERIEKGRNTPLDAGVELAVERLGNGAGISCQDTVAFCIWCAARHLDDFEAAMWTTVSGYGDRDTTCAIVGGMLGARVGLEGMPADWRHKRESLPIQSGENDD